jgi:hypothetical protein
VLIFLASSVRNLPLTNLNQDGCSALNALGFRHAQTLINCKSFSGKDLAADDLEESEYEAALPAWQEIISCRSGVGDVHSVAVYADSVECGGSRGQTTNPPPFDFTDQYYRANGIEPTRLLQRVGTSTNNALNWTTANRRPSSVPEHGPNPQPDPRSTDDRRFFF